MKKESKVSKVEEPIAFYFGNLDNIMALNNKKPKEFLDTSLGIELLMEELGRIEHGVFA